MLNGLKSKYNLDPILARAVATIVGPAFGWLTSNHISGHYFLRYFPIPSNTPFFFGFYRQCGVAGCAAL